MPAMVSSGVSDSAPANSIADLLPGSAPEPEPTPEPTPEPEPEPEPEPTPEPTPEPEPEPEDDPQAYMKWWKERYPAAPDPFDQYENDAAFFDGLAEKAKLVGQRDENAQLGKALRSAGVTETEIQDYLAKKNSKPSEPTAKGGGAGELQMLAAKIFDDNGNARKDAPREAVQQYGKIVKDLLLTVSELKADPKAFLKDVMDDMRKQVREELTQYDSYLKSQAAESAALQDFRAENPWLKDPKNPKGLSVQGQQLAQLADQIMADVEAATGRPLPLSKALPLAMDRLQAKQKAPPPPPGKPAARHTRNASPPTKEVTRSALIAKAGSMGAAIQYAEDNNIDWGTIKP